eukprot:TRINITY_DN10129_c0_g1_i1.p1 TRINITY_DN10129_c0_g1~~TRINITY_DN10129_c0_g1_i1.p1  ORF type:complete len:223 (-),score=66.52 TRINITY_DN10129_c0_g1_i1:593-1261(-)
MIRRPPRSTLSSSSAASDVYKRQVSTQSTGGSQDKMRLRCKVALVGDAMVGKTSLVAMFGSKGGNEFRKNYQMTIGAEVNFQEVVVPDSEPPTVVELFLFDTSGQDMYKPMAAKHWDASSAILLVYDVTNPQSFHNLERWLDMFSSVNPGRQVRGAVVANKTDLDERAAVPPHEGEAFAQKHDLEFFQTSAKNNTNVDIPFMFLASQFKDAYEEQLNEFSNM